MDRPVSSAVPHLPLTTEAGKRTSLAAYRGKIVVLGDFLTLCQEICPMTSANFDQMARAVAKAGHGGEVMFVEVTVDPRRDTPARLAAYRELFPAAPSNWVLATMSPGDLARLWKYFGVFYKRTEEDTPPAVDWWTHKTLTYDVEHQDAVIFLDQRAHERFLIVGNPDTAGASPPPSLVRFMSEQGRQNLQGPGPASWTPAQGLSVVSWLAGHKIGG